MDINIVTISGTVIAVTDNSIVFYQCVGGKKETEFILFLPAKIREEIKKMNLQDGDVILVTNGQIYENDGETRIRIIDPASLVKLTTAKSREANELYLGEESADQFI